LAFFRNDSFPESLIEAGTLDINFHRYQTRGDVFAYRYCFSSRELVADAYSQESVGLIEYVSRAIMRNATAKRAVDAHFRRAESSEFGCDIARRCYYFVLLSATAAILHLLNLGDLSREFLHH